MSAEKTTEKAQEIAPAPPASFIDRMAQAAAEVGHIEKRGRNQEQKYDYVTAVDISAQAVKCLAKYHIAFASDTEHLELIEGKTKAGYPKTIARIKMRYTFEDGLTDAKRIVYFHGEGQDSGDKAVYKAMTGALKYCLIQNLLIPTGDDPEDDADEKADSRRKTGRGATGGQDRDDRQPTGDGAAPQAAPDENLPPLSAELIAQRAQELGKLCEDSKTELEKITHHYGVASIEDIAKDDKKFEDAKKVLEKKIAKDKK